MIDLTTNRLCSAVHDRLLLIEDDASVVESLRLLLQTDYEVHTESTIASGIKRFRSLHPALVVLDLRLPDGEGLEFLREIRRNDKRTPVMILTGYASMRTVEESLRLGASDYLHKPFDGFTLKSRISQLLPKPGEIQSLEKRSTQELSDMQQQIAALKLKADASAMFLHDVASPVTTALTSAHYLCDLMEKTHSTDSNAMSMAELLTNALGFLAGLFEQSGSIENLKRLPTEAVEVDKIVSLALALVNPKAKNHKVSVGSHLKNPEARVCANRYALARVLVNLLNNGIEAVQPETGRVTLTTSVTKGWVEFSVMDNGPGIPPEIKEHIFEQRFTTKKEGNGLGLFISKLLVVGMGGDLILHSDHGHGCRFTLKLPLLS